LQEVFKELRGHGTLSEANIESALRHVRLALVEADVDFQVAKRFITQVKEKAVGETVLRSITPGQQVVKVFHDELTALLGGDAATGQQAVSVATHFNDALAITGIVLTKLDGDARGGAALSMREVTRRPIKFAGTGEKLDQFEVFVPERLAGRILGMGDVIGLVEKAAEAVDEEEAVRLERKLRTASFDFNE